MKRILTVIFTVILIVTFSQHASASDIDNHWAKSPFLDYLIQENIMDAENGNYYPDREITRAEFASFIARSLDLKETSTKQFSDVPPSYTYAADISKAEKAGIIKGYPDNTFKPNAKISRQHMAVMLNAALNYMEMPSKSATLKYTDTNQILKDYVNAVNNATAYGLFSGSPVNGKVYFFPNNNSTRAQASVNIYRLVSEIATAKPGSGIEKPPVVIVDNYELKKVENGKEVTIKSSTSYEDVLAGFNLSSGHFISKNGKNVKISYGLATANGLTNVYNSDKRTAFTYVASGSELVYKSVDADLQWVQVELAGRVGYVKLADVTLTPYSLLTGRNYYKVVNGELVHYLYNHNSKKYASYVTGKAPSFLAANTTYYSWDGIRFFDSSSRTVGEAYNYYQFLPVRSKTNYTAEEIDELIYRNLQRIENLAYLNPTYKDATTKSKLLNLGTTLKSIEEKYNVNALMILSLAINESAYGLSDRAQLENNLFGLYVYDSNPLLKEFESVEANIESLLNDFWLKNYVPPNEPYANGAAFGHKAIGFNIKYASDPYWGAKAAGHYYRLDKDLGKDKNFKIGITTTSGLNVRTGPGKSYSKEFTYSTTNMPVLIVGETNGWYNIASDLTGLTNVYVSKDYIRVLPTY